MTTSYDEKVRRRRRCSVPFSVWFVMGNNASYFTYRSQRWSNHVTRKVWRSFQSHMVETLEFKQNWKPDEKTKFVAGRGQKTMVIQPIERRLWRPLSFLLNQQDCEEANERANVSNSFHFFYHPLTLENKKCRQASSKCRCPAAYVSWLPSPAIWWPIKSSSPLFYWISHIWHHFLLDNYFQIIMKRPTAASLWQSTRACSWPLTNHLDFSTPFQIPNG